MLVTTLFLWITLAGCGGGDRRLLRGHVTKVVDGDTIVVGGVGAVRYIGIDTPELHHPKRPVERLARAARDGNAALVQGREVRLVTDRDPFDVHGRTLAYVYVGSTFVNAALLERGLARTLAIAPNTLHAEELAAIERRARQRGVGLWGPTEGGPPWGAP